MSLLIQTPVTRTTRTHSTIRVQSAVRAAVERRAAQQARMCQEAIDAILATESAADQRSAARIQAMIDQQVTAHETAGRVAEARFQAHLTHMRHVLACERAAVVHTARRCWIA